MPTTDRSVSPIDRDRSVRSLLIERPDAVLRGDATGTGPTVLMLHAGGERRQVWAPVMDVLVEAGFRCVAFDQRGHGDSDGAASSLVPFAEDAAAMVEAQPARCVVVGASLGGFAAIAAMADPLVQEKVSGLVLVDVVPDPEPRRVRLFLAAAGLLDTRAGLVDNILGRGDSLRQIIAALDMPILLVRGTASPLTDDDVSRLIEVAPHTTVTSVPHAGHLVARDQPVALGNAITSILLSLSARLSTAPPATSSTTSPGCTSW